MYNLVLSISYLGTNYHGFQFQPNLPTIEGELRKSLILLNKNNDLKIICSGRTDTGVHAFSQVINFTTITKRDVNEWFNAINNILPDDITVNWVKEITDLEFSSRFDAISRSYQYRILNNNVSNPFLKDIFCTHHKMLADKKMNDACQFLLGEHDFTSFRGPSCQSKSPVRTINSLKVTRSKNILLIDINANAFLHNMVRNIVGSLILIGEGKYEPLWIKAVLEAKDRTKAGPKAMAQGLMLMHPTYKKEFDFLNEKCEMSFNL